MTIVSWGTINTTWTVFAFNGLDFLNSLMILLQKKLSAY